MKNFSQHLCELCGVIQTHCEEYNGLRCVVCQTFSAYPCQTCDGSGGFDISKDCEVYDEWQNCKTCNGTGKEDFYD